ncbi:MAG: hypothetical protein V2A54_06340 [Bacteroidota bacterium]
MSEEPKNPWQRKAAGIGVTLLVHGGLIFIFMLMSFKTPIPPFPAEEPGGGGKGMGIEVNLGNAEDGYGDVQDEIVSQPEFNTKVQVSQNDLLSNENGENVSFNNVKNDNKTVAENNNDNANNAKNNVVNPALLYKGKSQGDGKGSGDKGNPNGVVDSKNYKGDGKGGGSGDGKGGGDGKGEGPGKGDGKGPGISIIIKDRVVKNVVKPVYNVNESGKVVVEVTLDRNGKVLRATAGAKGTTTSNRTLWKNSTDAALKTTFFFKKDAAVEQKGTITYNYILN